MTSATNREIVAKSYKYSIESGLTSQQVAESRAQYGANELTPPKRDPWWKELLEGFDDPTIKILLAAACLSLGVTAIEKYALKNADASFIDSIGIFIAVALATLVGFFSERKSAKEFEALNKIKDDVPIKVYRDGQIDSVPISSIVVGDVVEVASGDKIPADGIALESWNLYVDESTFTGESLGARKRSTKRSWDLTTLRQAGALGDDDYLARGSTISDGRAIMVVTKVGDATELGKIAEALEAAELDDSETPLTQKLGRLANQISVLGVSAATLIFTIMNIVAAARTPLTRAVFESTTGRLALIALSIVLGYVIERFLAKPFFNAMGTPVKSRKLLGLIFLPCAAASWTVLLGIWGLTTDFGVEHGVELLKSVLLAFVVAVTIIVVAVPEGLPMMTTISLALNTRKMARQNCLVRRLVASETIGSATVICTDKTGTLTRNQMTPTLVCANGRSFSPEDFDALKKTDAWRRVVAGIAVNSRANLHIEKGEGDAKDRVVGVGNPTECALLSFLRENDVDYHAERSRAANSIFDLEHNSDRKYSAAAFEDADGTKRCYVKGAPEIVLKRCRTIFVDGEERPLADYRAELESRLTDAAEHALRTLGFCEKVLTDAEAKALAEGGPEDQRAVLESETFAFVAFVGISDPPRPEAKDAVERCKGAGIQVKMITGDALPTAVAIAKAVGIYDGTPDQTAMTSEEFRKISDEDLPSAAEKIRVLARSTPSDKLRMVQALHKMGEVVAMTGDGTNDAPALKAADVGLSMGQTGSEVAKEASDVVLVDDNFQSVATGVWWGRSLFQNIRRFLQFQLSVNFTALLCSTLGPVVGVPLPLTVTQLLWINIIMDTFAALALSTDPPRPHVMKEKPVPRDANVVTKSMLVSIVVSGLYQVAILFAALFGGWFVTGKAFSTNGTDAENLESLTIFFTTLVMFQFWHKFNCRALRSDESPFTLLYKNKAFLGIVFSITALQIVMVQIPIVGSLFRTQPLSLSQWLEIVALTATILPVAWLGRIAAHKFGFERE